MIYGFIYCQHYGSIDPWTSKSCLASYLISLIQFSRGNKIVSDILDRGFGTELQTKDRALRLTYMTLRKFIGASLTNDCKTFWQHHSTLPSCFKDMRQFVEALTSAGDKAQFFEYFNNEVTPDQVSFVILLYIEMLNEVWSHALLNNCMANLTCVY